MMEAELMAMLTQFGMAGLVSWMWLSERRAAAAREQQLGDAHSRLMNQHFQLEALVKLVAENTRAVAAIEGGQQAILVALEAIARRRAATPPPGRPAPARAPDRTPHAVE